MILKLQLKRVNRSRFSVFFQTLMSQNALQSVKKAHIFAKL